MSEPHPDAKTIAEPRPPVPLPTNVRRLMTEMEELQQRLRAIAERLEKVLPEVSGEQE